MSRFGQDQSLIHSGPAPSHGVGPSCFPRLLIVGASVRAAAASAVRAGFAVDAIDLFGDGDLQAIARHQLAHRADFPESIDPLDPSRGPIPWIYTGPMENHPETVDRLSALHPLWGIGGDTLRAVRDPLHVHEVLRAAGLPVPDVRTDAAGLERDGTWLIKPRRSAGGLGIRPLGPDAAEPGTIAVYYQRRIFGLPAAAIFLADSRRCRCVGVTEQWLGHHTEPFCYVGSVGPLRVARTTRRILGRLGSVLRAEFALRGLFGVDFILDGEVPWPVEVNPRYTASVEALELARGTNLMAAHAAVFGADCHPPRRAPMGRYVGKAVLFASMPCMFQPRRARPADPSWPHAWYGSADLPAPGQTFEEGEPVMTVLARGDSPASCRDQLHRALGRGRRTLVRA